MIDYPSPECFRCGRTPGEIGEYIAYAKESDMTPDEFVVAEEGTYNPAHNTFCCTKCYVAIGMPSSPKGWVAPERMEWEPCGQPTGVVKHDEAGNPLGCELPKGHDGPHGYIQ